MPAEKRPRDIKRVGRFASVGVFNTLFDFFVLNLLTKFFFVGLIQANIVSTTMAMLLSFLLNKRVVFRHQHGSMALQAAVFFATTAFGLYAIQTFIIFVLTQVWTAPLLLAVDIVRALGISFFSDGFYINNGAKAVATAASLAWNYVTYRSLVFRSVARP